MKSIMKVVLLIMLSQFVYGCDNKETEKASGETVGQTAEAAEATATQTVDETPAVAVPASVNLPTAAPLQGLQWIKGEPVTFEKGKVYVVEFWATWCGPCKVSIPHLTEIQRTYRDKGVTVIGISNERPDTIKPFVEQMGDQMGYVIAADIDGFVQRNYMEAFNKQGIPQAFIVNGEGKIAWEGHPLDGMDPILELVVKGDFDPVAYAKQKAEAEALQQQLMNQYAAYFKILETAGLTPEAKQLSAEFIEKAPADGLDAFAWHILNRVKESDRDLQAALQAAQKANELTESKDPSVLDTYAMALFETAQIQQAIEMQKKAIDLVQDYPNAVKEFQQRLKKYQDALSEKI